jgi:chromosome segregation ATPase
VEKAAADKESRTVAEMEELRRQLEGASHEVAEWQQQLSDASEHLQQLQQQLDERDRRLVAAQV